MPQKRSTKPGLVPVLNKTGKVVALVPVTQTGRGITLAGSGWLADAKAEALKRGKAAVKGCAAGALHGAMTGEGRRRKPAQKGKGGFGINTPFGGIGASW